ncbi:hypothetical protein E5288_WYG020483 [Bos mutus]|uniref:C2H2-type domain-containing protein n=1 Tax=Bos mutus TaxID=72004 RepID=A0A6B0S9S3_9CETA|nr:hypothetical protein [Bos mutus]
MEYWRMASFKSRSEEQDFVTEFLEKPQECEDQMDPIQKAVINHTFGVPLPHRRKQIISCNICQLRFNSDSQAAAHYKGTKHAKKLKALEAMKTKQKSVTAKDSAKTTFTSITTNTINASSDKTDSTTGTPAISTTTVEIRKSSVMTTEITSKVEKSPTTASGNSSCPSAETEEEKAKRLLYCSLCKVAVNSASQLEAHNSGTKHKTMLEARNGSGAIKAFPRAGVKGKGPANKGNTGLQNKTFHCEICDVHVNSETQLKQHISSRRHKDRAAGKPPKPKYSPYNKLQKAAHPLGMGLCISFLDLEGSIMALRTCTDYCFDPLHRTRAGTESTGQPQWFAQLHNFQCNRGPVECYGIIDDVFGFPRSTASDERSCDNDSLLTAIEENRQRSWKGNQDVKDGRQDISCLARQQSAALGTRAPVRLRYWERLSGARILVYTVPRCSGGHCQRNRR